LYNLLHNFGCKGIHQSLINDVGKLAMFLIILHLHRRNTTQLIMYIKSYCIYDPKCEFAAIKLLVSMNRTLGILVATNTRTQADLRVLAHFYFYMYVLPRWSLQ
jgi:hypothetical protein